MTTLYRSALGPVNVEQYLPRFARFDAIGRIRPGWNWAASVCTLNWMALRHLWSAALVYVAAVEGLALLVFGVGRTLLQWPDAVQWGLIAVFALLAFVLPGLYGDAVLHTEIRKRIGRALAATHTIPEACAQLGRQASSWKRLMGLALLNLVLLGAAAAAYWYPPQGNLSGGQAPAAAPLPVTGQPPANPVIATPAAEPASAPEPTPTPTPTPAPAAATQTSSTEPLASAAAPASAASDTTPATRATLAAALVAPPESAPAKAVPGSTAASSARATRQPASPPKARASAPPATPTTALAAKKASAPASTPAAKVGSAPGYYINAGLFAEEANARKTQARLLNEGLPAFRQTLKTAKGERIRVRVGPYPTAKAANAAAAQVRSLKLEAMVFKQ